MVIKEIKNLEHWVKDVALEAFLMLGNGQYEKQERDSETRLGKAQLLCCRINLKTTFLGNDVSCIFKMYIEKPKLGFCLIKKDQEIAL